MKWQGENGKARKSRPVAEAGNGTSHHPDRDYTPEVLQFLEGIHGKIRQNQAGDYYYDSISTISLHFLLSAGLPSKEVLWGWYRYFDQECAESIYQSLPPLRDEALLEVLERCSFRCDLERVRASGLIFLGEHRRLVHQDIEQFMNERLDHYLALDDDALRQVLQPRNAWTEVHLRRLVRQIQTRPLDYEQRQAIYQRFGSDYVRATARHLMDEVTTEAFWRAPPEQLEELKRRFAAFRRTMAERARELGVYVTREEYEWTGWEHAWRGRWRTNGGAGAGAGRFRAATARPEMEQHFAALGLDSSATLGDVKMAYREKVKQCHPDQGGTVQEFLRVQEAYEYLVTRM